MIQAKYFLDKNYKKRVVSMFIFHNIFHGLFMILIKKYKVRLFIILTHLKMGIGIISTPSWKVVKLIISIHKNI